MIVNAHTDARGLAITTGSDAAVAAFDDFERRLLRLDQGAEAIIEAAGHCPDAPMVHLGAAAFCLFGQTPTSDAAAAGFLASSDRITANANAREQAWARALGHWAAKEHLRTAAELEAITEAWPADLFAAKTCEFIYYVLGQEHEGRRFLAHMERIAPVHGGDPDFLAMYAFALELCGRYADACRIADDAIALEPRLPWAHHALAHALAKLGEVETAIDRLTDYARQWPQSARVIDCHNAWHLALLHIERLDFDPALALLAERIDGPSPDLVQQQIDVISLLWRLELAGGPPLPEAGRLWEAIAARIEPVVETVYMPFLSAHHVYALARAGDEDGVARCLEAVDARTRADDAEAVRTWRPIGQAMVRAAVDFALGDEVRTATQLDPVIGRIAAGGGSDAQVDLFRQTYLASLIGCGRRNDARSCFERMTRTRPLTPLDRQWLAQINAT